jgi:hypothetical protein
MNYYTSMTCKMTYTPKTKRPTVKSLLEGLKRLEAEFFATQKLLDDTEHVADERGYKLKTIGEVARLGNKFGHRAETLAKIHGIAATIIK